MKLDDPNAAFQPAGGTRAEMKYDAFARAAERAFEEIPPAYREGVDGLTVSRSAHAHPERAGVWTLGECVTESYPSDFGSAETVRSVVVLYWGSFRNLAREDPDFDWDAELWETLTHELKHHLESLAADDGLEGVDYAMDEHFARLDGESFDPWYYRRGEPVPGGGFRFEDHLFWEREWKEAPPARVQIDVGGRPRLVPVPEDLADVHFLVVEDAPADGPEIEVVLVRRVGLRERVGRALKGGSVSLGETLVRMEGEGERE